MKSKEKRRGGRPVERKAEAAIAAAPPHSIAAFRWFGRDGAIWLGMLAVVAGYYYWTVNPTGGEMLHSHYTLLTDAFIFHQTYLRVTPSPELLALPDPYDPDRNAQYKLHDASLYKGKYYLYFGPAPVVLLFLPYWRVKQEFLPDGMGVFLFAVAAYVLSCLMLKLVLETWWPRSSRRLYFFVCAVMAFSNTFPIMMRRAGSYEVAIAAGQCFVLLGLYSLARAALGRGAPLAYAAVGGAALAAAFGSRPQLVLAAAALAWFLLVGRGLALRVRLTRLAAALVPFAAGAALIFWYNYIRFGSILEFGTHYQLAGMNVRKMQYFSLARMFPNLWFSVLQPPHLQSSFPFVSLNLSLLPHPPARTGGVDPMTGLLWLTPLVLALTLAPLVRKRIDPERRKDWAIVMATLAGLGAAWAAIDDMLGVTMRYQADCCAVLLLAAAFVIPGIASPRLGKNGWMARAVIAVGLFGIVMSAALVIEGNENGLDQTSPRQFAALSTVFTPVSKLLGLLGIAP